MENRKYKISEIADLLDLKIETIRFYEKKGLIPEVKRTEAGYRVFTDYHLAILSFIIKSKKLGFTLKEIEQVIKLNIADYLVKEDRDDKDYSDIHRQLAILLEKKISELEGEIVQMTHIKDKLMKCSKFKSYSRGKNENS